MRHNDLTGQTFGRLKVLSRRPNRGTTVVWLCECQCDERKLVEVDARNLRSGHTKSCGCLMKERAAEAHTKHGLSYHPIRRVYTNMHSRCENPKTYGYERYGGRGIKVCEEWSGESGFKTFYTWAVASGWESGLELDRVDDDGDYSPHNCRFVKHSVNAKNRRSTDLITYDGVTLCRKDWAARLGISEGTIKYRLKKGMSVKEAFSTPVKTGPNAGKKVRLGD